MNKQNLVSYLEEKNVEYEIINHTRSIKTAQEGADYHGIDISQTAPTLILRTERGYFCLIISGNYGRVVMSSLKGLLNAEEVRLANPQEVEEVTGTQIGNVSLINPELPTIIDRELYRYSHIYGGAGEPQTTLKLRSRDMEKLINVIGYVR